MIQIVRIVENLPEAIGELRAEADAEPVGGPARLTAQWRSGEQRFNGEGEALFAAFVGGELAGVGGLTIETGASESAMRMRHLYVRPGFRRAGVGRALASVMIQQGFEAAVLLTANAAASDAAPPFWEAMGFASSGRTGFTHWLRR